MTKITTKRIPFIDLTKGVCILLVILFHVGGPINQLDPHHMIASFRMPLYFFISGVFFKPYNGATEFIIRKINRLIIPFLFFFLIPFFCAYILRGIKPDFFQIAPSMHELLIPFSGHSLIRYNPPIWFLLALFVCNGLFYIVHKWLRQRNEKLFILTIIGIGCIGYILAKSRIELPLYIDVAMAALPFYFGGFWIRRYNFFLQKHRYDKYIPTIVVCLIILLYFSAGDIGLRCNVIHNSLVGFYLAGFSGILSILLVCKLINHLPIVSQLGKTSIVALGIHSTIIVFLQRSLSHFFDNPWWQIAVIYTLTIIACYALTPIITTLFPRVVAQKDFIKIQPGPDKLHPLVYKDKTLMTPEEEYAYFRNQKRLERQMLIRRLKKNTLSYKRKRTSIYPLDGIEWTGAQTKESIEEQLKEIQDPK